MLQQTSVLVDKQFPMFVREEYPEFIHFVKRYYDFFQLPSYSRSCDSSKIKTDDYYNISVDEV